LTLRSTSHTVDSLPSKKISLSLLLRKPLSLGKVDWILRGSWRKPQFFMINCSLVKKFFPPVGLANSLTLSRRQPQFPYDAMHITFYRSALCPRCHLAKRYLTEITSRMQEIDVEYVNIVSAPLRAWNDGIRMVPALKIDTRILSGMLLSRDNIADFIAHSKS